MVDYILEMADVTDREATLEEIMAAPDEDAAEEKPKTAKKPAKKSSAKSKKKE